MLAQVDRISYDSMMRQDFEFLWLTRVYISEHFENCHSVGLDHSQRQLRRALLKADWIAPNTLHH